MISTFLPETGERPDGYGVDDAIRFTSGEIERLKTRHNKSRLRRTGRGLLNRAGLRSPTQRKIHRHQGDLDLFLRHKELAKPPEYDDTYERELSLSKSLEGATELTAQLPEWLSGEQDGSMVSAIVARHPELVGGFEVMRQVREKVWAEFGLPLETDEEAKRALDDMVWDDGIEEHELRQSLRDQRGIIERQATHGGELQKPFGAGNFLDTIFYDAIKESAGNISDAKVKEIMDQHYKVLHDEMNSSSPDYFQHRVALACLEVQEAKGYKLLDDEVFKPRSNLITDRGLHDFVHAPRSARPEAELFSYPSAGGDVLGREQLNWDSSSSRHYGDALRSVVIENSSRRVVRMVRNAGTLTCHTLSHYGMAPSRWTVDGSWALWDIGKRRYFKDHPEIQQDHLSSPADRDVYEEDFDITNAERTSRQLAERQIGWEMVHRVAAADKPARKALTELLARSHGHIDDTLRMKLNTLLSGEQARFKSSELSLLGRALLPRYDG